MLNAKSLGICRLKLDAQFMFIKELLFIWHSWVHTFTGYGTV